VSALATTAELTAAVATITDAIAAAEAAEPPTPPAASTTGNVYLSTDQFLSLRDQRTMLELSSDTDDPAGNMVNLQFVLDVAADELDGVLTGRVSLPLANPPKLCISIVAAIATDALWGRRADKPKQVADEAAWARDWMEKYSLGKVSLPGVSRGTLPNLEYSDTMDGTSKFDWIMGQSPSVTGPGGGK
jgi:phage gp36-like protein